MISSTFSPRSSFCALLLILCFVLPWAVGCEDGSLNAPKIQGTETGEENLFESYVALGNSITAGFQSSGINSTTQSQSFASILADSMHTPFGVPTLAGPGCPPPLTSFFNEQGIPTPQRPENTDAETCGLRDPELPPRVNNVAVPGAAVVDALSNSSPSSSPNPLTQFLLGGRTQIEAALDADPTFATVWIGNNDVLGAALEGTDDVTPLEEFTSRYGDLLDRLTASSNFEGGVLIGVSNVTLSPFFSPGPVYVALDQQGQFPPNFNVASSCNAESNAGLTPLVSVEYGFTLIGQALAAPNQTVTLDCQAEDTPVLTLDEVSTLVQTVQQYNEVIRTQAQERNLAFFNPNDVLRPLYAIDNGDADPTNDPIPKFPDRDSEQPFGEYFSLDGIHPSAATHRVVAARLVQTINDRYDTSLNPPTDVPSLPTSPEVSQARP